MKLDPRRRVVSMIVMAAGAVLGTAVLGPACGPTGVEGSCKGEQIDCVTTQNYFPGADCVNGQCMCTKPGYILCCEKGNDICSFSCRPIENCAPLGGAAGTQGSSGEVMGEGGSGGEGAAGSSGGNGSATGSGGAGGGPECITPADCPQPADARCGEATCKDGVCGLVFVAKPGEFVPLDSQIRGDCQVVVCDATGYSIVIPDASDVYNDGKICTDDVCEGGMALNIDFEDALPCPGGGSGYCHHGECVECVSLISGPNQNCGAGNECDITNCVPTSCVANGICGDACGPCAAGHSCDEASDCKDGVCSPEGMCTLPSCSDGVKNDGETDADCGAAVCKTTCADGKGCSTGADCASGVCWVGTCEAPTCADGVLNGGEVGVDCGGPCAACPP